MNEDSQLSKIATTCLFLSFFSAYVGIISLVYAVMLPMLIVKVDKNYKITFYDFFHIIVLLVFACLKFFQVGFFTADSILRYYLGVVLVYQFSKTYAVKLDIQKILFVFCICVIAEGVIINIFFDPFQYLPNYPHAAFEEQMIGHYTKFMGFYQRPYSVGMNSSTSSTILCAMMIFRDILIKNKAIVADKKIEILGAVSILMLASGVGLALYFFYLLHKFQLLTLKRFLILLAIVVLMLNYYAQVSEFISPDSIFQKVSSGYVNFLEDYKTEQVTSVFSELKEPGNSLWIGKAFETKSEIITQSDFAWNDLFICLGFGGLILLISFLVNKVNKFTLFPILIFIIGAFHYGGMFTLAGQIILAQILCADYQPVHIDKNTAAEIAAQV